MNRGCNYIIIKNYLLQGCGGEENKERLV